MSDLIFSQENAVELENISKTKKKLKAVGMTLLKIDNDSHITEKSG